MASTLDRTMAIACLAQRIEGCEEAPKYMHGLWRRHIRFDPPWYVESRQTNTATQRQTPSWL